MATKTKREFRESIDTTLLIIAFIAGVGSAVILKVLNLPDWVPALAAGTVIISYAAATYFSSAARLEPEQIGDNCYYLGFCITLASLSYTLFALGKANSDAAMLRDVISGFGVALSSTVVGVMTRLVLLQFRVDLAARDKEARSQLNQVMRSFHGEMQSSVTSTRETITQIRQTLDEHTLETIENNRRMQESFDKRISALVEEAVTGVKAAMNEVVDNGKDMNRRLSASSRTNMTAAEKAIQESLDIVTEDLKRATARLEEEMQRANATSIKALERIIVDVSASMKLLSEEATKSIDLSRQAQSAEMTKAVEAVAANVFEIASQIGAQKDRLRESHDGFVRQIDEARHEVGSLVQESTASRESTRKAAQSVEAVAAEIANSVVRMEKVATGIAERTTREYVAANTAVPELGLRFPTEVVDLARQGATPLVNDVASQGQQHSPPAVKPVPPTTRPTPTVGFTSSETTGIASGASLKQTTAMPPVSDVEPERQNPRRGRSFVNWFGVRK